jgi:hypothetical protein
MTPRCYSINISLPQIPEELILEPTELQWKSIDGHNFNLTVDGKKKVGSTYYRYEPGQALKEWVRDCIHPDIATVGLQIVQGTDIFQCHTDTNFRRYIFNYLVKNGGANATTVFYQEHGFPAEQDVKKYINDYSTIDVIDSVIVSEKTWFSINGQVLHGVTNLESPRIAVSLGIPNAELYNSIIDKYNILGDLT